MNAQPSLSVDGAEALSEPVVKLDRIERSFGIVQALRGISLALKPGRALALVGESGCGKTTCARIIARMDETTAGRMYFRCRVTGRLRPLTGAPCRWCFRTRSLRSIPCFQSSTTWRGH